MQSKSQSLLTSSLDTSSNARPSGDQIRKLVQVDTCAILTKSHEAYPILEEDPIAPTGEYANPRTENTSNESMKTPKHSGMNGSIVDSLLSSIQQQEPLTVEDALEGDFPCSDNK